MDFPGGKVAYTTELSFISESADKRIPCYRVLDDNGEPTLSNNFVQVSLNLVFNIIFEPGQTLTKTLNFQKITSYIWVQQR
jgi:hypothetical protein